MIQLSNGIRRMRMKWTGHILRMSNNKTVKQVFSWKPSSRRSQGRPKKCWMDCVEEGLCRAGISRYGITTGRQCVSLQEIAGDRSQWREWVAASTILTAIFPGGPGLASTRMSLFWIILKLRVMEVVVTMGAIRRAKLQSNCHHRQTINQFFYRSIPSCHSINIVRALNKKCSDTENG